METKLNIKQMLFVQEYLIDLNATQAYIRAGYKSKGDSAKTNAARMIANDHVSAAIQEAMDKRSKSLGLDAEYVLRTIKETIERCSQAVKVMDADGATGVYKFDAGAVLKGCELLGRHLKMFTDKVEVGCSVSLSEAIVASRYRCGK